VTDGYEWEGPIIDVAVNGEPAPQGSKSFKGIAKNGRAIMVESSRRVKPWRHRVQDAFEGEIRALADRFPGMFPLTGPVALELTFTMRKPASAPKRRRTFPVKRPDVDKLLRAVLDAGTAAGLWCDDSQVVDLSTRKAFPAEHPDAGSVPGIRAFIYTIREN
jgi:crossover junction endodeoxyribonuclease RusA